MIESYDAFVHYCESREIPVDVRNHAFCIYVDSYKNTIRNLPNNKPLTIQTTKDALLQDDSIEGFVARAENIVQKIAESTIKPYESKRMGIDFKRNVIASVLGSFLYSIIIVTAFFLAKEHVYSFLESQSDSRGTNVQMDELTKD